jgi:hypothetical protein
MRENNGLRAGNTMVQSPTSGGDYSRRTVLPLVDKRRWRHKEGRRARFATFLHGYWVRHEARVLSRHAMRHIPWLRASGRGAERWWIGSCPAPCRPGRGGGKQSHNQTTATSRHQPEQHLRREQQHNMCSARTANIPPRGGASLFSRATIHLTASTCTGAMQCAVGVGDGIPDNGQSSLYLPGGA